MSAAAIPWALSAAITFVISAASARSAAEAVLALVDTPNETCARSGTALIDPVPATTIACWTVGASVDALPEPAAPSSSTAQTEAMAAGGFMRRSYVAGRTPCHIQPQPTSWRFRQ